MPKINSDVVRAYHAKLSEIKVRFPDPEQCGCDYAALIRERAEELGLFVERGRDKGRGSANAYILHLIEQDLGVEIKTMRDLEK